MPEFDLAYNREQWADMMEALGKARPPKGGIQGWDIITTVKLNGIFKIVELKDENELKNKKGEKND